MMMVKEAPASRNTPEWGARLEWREYMAGWSSGMLNITITFPINKTMFRSDKMPIVRHNILIYQATIAWNISLGVPVTTQS